MVTITFNLYYLELHSFNYSECIKPIIIMIIYIFTHLRDFNDS